MSNKFILFLSSINYLNYFLYFLMNSIKIILSSKLNHTTIKKRNKEILYINKKVITKIKKKMIEI